MQDAFLDFEWTVAPRYEWQEWLNDGIPQVVPAESFESAAAIERAWRDFGQEREQTGPVLRPILGTVGERSYRPMQREHAALFREFAALDPADRTAILAFASKYGALGLVNRSQTVVEQPLRRFYHAYGTSHLAWALEISRMQRGLKLADNHDTFELSRQLKGLVDRHLQDVRGRLAFDRAGAPRLRIEPIALIAAMWLQLALSVTEGKLFPMCKFCGRFFEISTEETGYRSHRQFCTDSCKTKDYRRRRRTALQLAENGVPVSSIVDRVATDKVTVKRWLTRSRSEKEKR